jgi:hypothetical protein
MNTSTLLKLLVAHPKHHLQFILPDGGRIPIHAHITEVGRIDKTFLDCGATVRKISNLSLQAWVAEDTDHRLPAGKLAEIIDRAAPIIGNEDLDVELEYEDGLISQFPVESGTIAETTIVFILGSKHTDCLAKEICLPPSLQPASDSCCSGSGCC